MNVLVTGATGFVGAQLCRHLISRGMHVTAAVRKPPSSRLVGSEIFVQHSELDKASWVEVLRGKQVVVHAAGRAHIMHERVTDSLAEYRRINVEGTLNLARQCAAAAIKRFVFLSSIKVNGEVTFPGAPFTAGDRPLTADAYGRSKLEAEEMLQVLSFETGMEVVIIRPPLVYGPGVRANFLSMMKWLCDGVPLPLGAIHNNRSLIALDNLTDFIATCLDHVSAAGQTFLISDGEDISTTALLQRLGEELGHPARLIPIPMVILKTGATFLGRKALARRLCGSLQIDSSKSRDLLGWKPPIGLNEGLKRTAAWYLETHV